jgi:hypothetical protein
MTHLKWIACRAALIAYAVYMGFIPIDGQKSNVNWELGVAFGLLMPIFIGYYVRVKAPRDVEFGGTWNFAQPLYPFRRYPLRMGLLGSVLIIAYGVSGRIHQAMSGDFDDVTGSINSAFDFYISFGIVYFLAIGWWSHRLKKERRGR